jgi:hypothetical protein
VEALRVWTSRVDERKSEENAFNSPEMAVPEVPIRVAESEEFALDSGQSKDIIVNLLHHFRSFENLPALQAGIEEIGDTTEDWLRQALVLDVASPPCLLPQFSSWRKNTK